MAGPTVHLGKGCKKKQLKNEQIVIKRKRNLMNRLNRGFAAQTDP